MTTAAATHESDRDRRVAPEEGWAVLALVIAMGLILATAMDEPAWINGRGVLTDCLVWAALGGTAVGVVGAKVGWGRWTTHLIGATFAALLLPIIAGWAVFPGQTAAQAFRFTANGCLEAYLDLTVRGYSFTIQEVHFVLVLTGLVWGTMQFGSYAVFGHRRPLTAIVIMGLVLIGNMALTKRDQLGWLVLYAGVALFLLIQMHTVGERSTWSRRRIGDPGSISFIYLRGGTVFIVAATVLSLALTFNAASSPLAGAWKGLNTQLVQISKTIGRLLPVGGDVRGGSGVAFGSSATISLQWYSDTSPAMTIDVPPAAAGLKLRAVSYADFAIGGWMLGEPPATGVPANTSMLVDSPEVPDPKLYDPVTIKIHPSGYHDTTLLSPGIPDKVDQPTTLYLSGQQGWFATDTIAADTAYTVTGLVPRMDETTGITQNKLRAASTEYPPDIQQEYTNIPDGTMGKYSNDLLKTVIAKAGSLNPYDLATTIETYLRSPVFGYSTDIRNQNCDTRSAVECFARFKIGYCQQYATTMAILLRAANPANPIPTRYVQGFLPSKIVNGQEQILNSQAHAWVEVYFPGYGWISFDPTGGQIGQPQTIPVGDPVPTAAPASRSFDPEGSGLARPTRRVFDNPGTGTGGTKTPTGQVADRGMAILIAVLLAGTLGMLILVAWYRGPRGEISPEAAWANVSKSASRFGFAPRPTQTVYEYASSLGELVPVARPDITTVADAKVETTYARAQLSPEREHAVAASMRRLRVTLLRLLITPRRRKKQR